MPMCDYLKYYDLESFCFGEVCQRFEREGSIGAFDFFSIIIWKANRAKSKVANKLLEKDTESRIELEAIVRALTTAIHQARDDQARMALLIKNWGFRLPIASAILTVLYPTRFTVYDVRVCDSLQAFHGLASVSNPDRLWQGYLEFKSRVENSAPDNLSLRDKDRYLWGKSASEQLTTDIRRLFQKEETGQDEDV